MSYRLKEIIKASLSEFHMVRSSMLCICLNYSQLIGYNNANIITLQPHLRYY